MSGVGCLPVALLHASAYPSSRRISSVIIVVPKRKKKASSFHSHGSFFGFFYFTGKRTRENKDKRGKMKTSTIFSWPWAMERVSLWIVFCIFKREKRTPPKQKTTMSLSVSIPVAIYLSFALSLAFALSLSLPLSLTHSFSVFQSLSLSISLYARWRQALAVRFQKKGILVIYPLSLLFPFSPSITL